MKLPSKISLGCITSTIPVVYSMEYSEESFENVEPKKPSVPDLGAQIFVEIIRWLLDQLTVLK